MAVSLNAAGAAIAFRDGGIISLAIEGGDSRALMAGEGSLDGAANYLLGPRPQDWITRVPAFERVRTRAVYPGIDAVFYSRDGMLEYDFVAAPGADPGRIRLRFGGARSLALDAQGDLVISTRAGTLRHHRPLVYQEIPGRRVQIAASYRLERGNRVRFDIGAYDRSRPLVIDPVLTYSTYLGGSGDDGHYGALAVDSGGAVYLAGESVRLPGLPGDFPTTPGAYRTAPSSGTRSDAFITKLSADGSRLIYSTYIGGSAGDVVTRVALAPDGSLYFAGHTDSTDFPVTSGVMQTRHAGGRFDVFLGRLSADGAQLLFSTYIGGAGADLARGLVYTASRVIVALQTESSGFPTSAGAAQAARAGAADLYLLGVRPDGSAALTATYFGGAGADEPNSLYLDPAGNLLVAGRTASANFPTMEGSPARAGATDAFVLKLNTNFGLVFSRLIGGSGAEAGLAVSADASNNVYVGGDTASADFPATTGAFQTRQKGDADAFIAKLTPAGAIVYNTLLGGEGGEAVFALAPDAQGAVTAAGFSFSTGFPVTADAWQTASAIDYADKLADAFLTRLNPAGTALQFSTLLGGNFGEEARALHVDGAGIATLAGATYADDWPVTAGALKATLGACRVDLGSDCQRLFLAKVDLNRNEASGPRVLLNGVVGAADYFRGGVAPGDVITVYGSEIGPPALAGLQLDSSGAVSRSLAGARILFDGTPAALVYVSSGQVSAVVPYQVGGNPTTTLVAEYQGRRSNPVVLPVRASRMALFTANSSGAGQAAALNADGSFNRRGSAVARGSVIVLYGTGMGMLDPAPPIGGINGLPLPRPVGEVTATIGGKNANVQYAGGAPGLIAGVVQVNLEVPPDAPVGDAVPVEIRVNGAPSRTGVTIAVR